MASSNIDPASRTKAAANVQTTTSAPGRPTQLAISPVTALSPAALSPTSNVSTPTSTSANQLAMKPLGAGHQMPTMAATLPSPQQFPKSSITSREWVVPPRPKPGRKPATDTPPTKRKAQNRAAQRAFRERRAARVGELEEQLEQQKEVHDQTEQDLLDRVQSLDLETHTLRQKCTMLENLLEKERAGRIQAVNDFEDLKRRVEADGSSTVSRSSRIQSTTDHRGSATSCSISQIISPPESSDLTTPAHSDALDSGCGSCDPAGSCACMDQALVNSSVGCGRCSLGTKCECLESALEEATEAEYSATQDLKRPASRSASRDQGDKRQKPDYAANEIDFTAMFSAKKHEAPPAAQLPQPASVHIPPRDSCGFCEEGTYCMCAEAAAAAAAAAANAASGESQSAQSNTLAPMMASQQVQTPPPSENDVGANAYEITSTGAVKLPSLQSLKYNRNNTKRSGGCGASGPGTCAQCLADPKSGLFCRSLAASFERQGGSAGGCCGGSRGGGCCKSKGSSATVQRDQDDAVPRAGVNLSCAEAYRTLSSHRNFDKAADEIATWLPKLKAIPMEVGGETPAGMAAARARPPIEVEAASIMSVLKGFDVRFGRNA